MVDDRRVSVTSFPSMASPGRIWRSVAAKSVFTRERSLADRVLDAAAERRLGLLLEIDVRHCIAVLHCCRASPRSLIDVRIRVREWIVPWIGTVGRVMQEKEAEYILKVQSSNIKRLTLHLGIPSARISICSQMLASPHAEQTG
jgi:hypothetical protein